MKNFLNVFGIIALIAVIGFTMAACSDGGDDTNNTSGIKVPSVSELPAFPADSTPAATAEKAETILAEFRQSRGIYTIIEEISEVLWMYGYNNFTNQLSSDGSVRVSYNYTANGTNTGGFKTLTDNSKAINDLYNDINALYSGDSWENYDEINRLYDEINRLNEEQENIQFAHNDRSSGTYVLGYKGEVTRAMTEGDVTIAQGSKMEVQANGGAHYTVSEAGPYTTFRINGTYSENGQEVMALTVTTSSGSVKVILDANDEYSRLGNDVRYHDFWNDVGAWTEIEKYSGSLKVYGKDNTLLIDHQIVDEESYDAAMNMISPNSTIAAPIVYNTTGIQPAMSVSSNSLSRSVLPNTATPNKSKKSLWHNRAGFLKKK